MFLTSAQVRFAHIYMYTKLGCDVEWLSPKLCHITITHYIPNKVVFSNQCYVTQGEHHLDYYYEGYTLLLTFSC